TVSGASHAAAGLPTFIGRSSPTAAPARMTVVIRARGQPGRGEGRSRGRLHAVDALVRRDDQRTVGGKGEADEPGAGGDELPWTVLAKGIDAALAGQGFDDVEDAVAVEGQALRTPERGLQRLDT